MIFIIFLIINLIYINLSSNVKIDYYEKYNTIEDYRKNGTLDILKIVKQYLPEDPIILEAGARFGEDTEHFVQFWPKSKIYAFEPHPNSFDKLKLISTKYNNIFIFPLALNNSSEKHIFYTSSINPGASSLLKPIFNEAYINMFDKNQIEVDCIRLDEWSNKNNINNIDFMWLDMEGSELLALSTSGNLLNNVKVIFIEINFLKYRENTCIYEELKNFLEKKSFKEIYRREWREKTWGDAIFIKSDNANN